MNFRNTIRLTSILCFALSINVSVIAQDSLLTDSRGNPLPNNLVNRISINLDDVPLTDALHEVARMGNFHLNYSEDLFSVDRKISIEINNEPAVIVLRKILLSAKIDVVVTKKGQVVLIKYNSTELYRSEKKHTISGFITDEGTGEALIGTNIFIEELRTGCATNAYGFYSITIPDGFYTIRYSFIGYQTEKKYSSLFRDLNLNIELRKESLSIDTVIVTSKFNDFLESTEISTVQLDPVNLDRVPYLLGEIDILRTLHLLPGVTFGREGDCGFYVRGGDHDQNLTLLDEAPVYNAFHSFGFFSVFNSDAIKNVKLIKGAAPPKYGGRLSSILDIQMNEGNLKEFSGVAGIGLIFSRFTLQAPFVKDKSSFIISARRTYLDVFKLFSSDENLDDATLYFYDLNAKANFRLSNEDRIYISGYFGNDGLGFTDAFDMNWGNATATLRWNHLFSDKLFLNTSLIYSRFNHETKVLAEDDNDETVEIISKVNDITLKEDFQYFIDANNTVNFGLNYIYHNYLPGHMLATGQDAFEFIIGKRNAHELSLFTSHEYKVNDRFKIDYGIRSTLFSVEGEEDIFIIDDIEESPNIEFHKNENTNYWRIEPRITLNYQLNKFSSLKAGYSINHQYIHMVSNSTSGTPLDVWQPASSKVKPHRADQISLGYFQNFGNEEYEFSVEAYHKRMKNLIDFKDGANIVLRNYFESELVFGEGLAYGIEFFLRKNAGDFTGWISYTLSKSKREFSDINNGRPFPAKYDRTHDFSLVTSYKLGERWIISANWVYTSGYNVTIPYGRYNIDDRVITAYSDRNGYRMKPYHRLDVGISFTNSLGGTWNFSLYNAYARRNTYMISIRDSESNPAMKEAVRYALFGIVPSISYTLRF